MKRSVRQTEREREREDREREKRERQRERGYPERNRFDSTQQHTEMAEGELDVDSLISRLLEVQRKNKDLYPHWPFVGKI
ncbi:hypothetical protein JZ751_006979 [Albula glossodonta]|uniref:Uncharacterized protein n=1 Tax=Albula glossodonta TaxID=121402 RepID=A0A8T2PD60_9TELE|nr:hypothetical protein JZ751_006979 [Albula glossodonta]